MKSRVLVTYSEVFDDKSQLSDEMLANIDKPTWAKIVARLNFLARRKENYPVRQVLNDWFSKDDAVYSDALFRRIVEQYQKRKTKYADLGVINIWSNLTLLDRILGLNRQSSQNLGRSASEKELFNTYLIVNEIFKEKNDDFKDLLASEEGIITNIAKTYLPRLISYHELNHFDENELVITNFVKTFLCLEFLCSSYAAILYPFLALYGVDNWREYLKSLMSIAKLAFNEGDGSGLTYIDVPEGSSEQSRNLFGRISLTDTKIYSEKYDFIYARSFPLYEVEKGKFLILDKVLMVNRIYHSMFFEMKDLVSNTLDLKRKYKDFFSLYTFEFIEKYLSYFILNYIFERFKGVKLTGEQIGLKGYSKNAPDFYVRNGNKVFLIEVKGSILRGDTKQSFDYAKIRREIDDKFVYDTKKNDHKAVLQLVDRIEILYSGKAGYDIHCNYKKRIRVYPILIVSDLSMTTPGVNHLLNIEFQNAVANRDSIRERQQDIANLVIIDLDTLILYADYFREDPMFFEKLVKEYNSFISSAEKSVLSKKISLSQYSNPVDGLRAKCEQAITPFSKFIRGKLPRRTPEMFTDFGKRLIYP